MRIFAGGLVGLDPYVACRLRWPDEATAGRRLVAVYRELLGAP